MTAPAREHDHHANQRNWSISPTEVLAFKEEADPEIRTLASIVVYTDPWIRLRKDDIELRDGSRGTYAVVERDDSALIVPAAAGGFHLVEEYRYPVSRRGWSFPQGGFPPGETGTPEELAWAELPRRPVCAPVGSRTWAC